MKTGYKHSEYFTNKILKREAKNQYVDSFTKVNRNTGELINFGNYNVDIYIEVDISTGGILLEYQSIKGRFLDDFMYYIERLLHGTVVNVQYVGYVPSSKMREKLEPTPYEAEKSTMFDMAVHFEEIDYKTWNCCILKSLTNYLDSLILNDKIISYETVLSFK